MLKRQNNQKEAGIGAFKKQKFVFSKLINFAVPDTIDPRVINLGSKLSLFKKLENLTLAINSAQVPLSARFLASKNILGRIW